MNRKRNIETKFLLVLRHLGMLCKKPQVKVDNRIRISHTVYPDGKRFTPIEAERHVWLENKKSGYKNCEFNVDTYTCKACSLDLEDFIVGGCIKKKPKK